MSEQSELSSLKRFFLAACWTILACALVPGHANAQDQDLNKYAGCQGSFYCGGNGTPLQGISWGAFTQNYLLTPRNPDQGICIYVVNNNPTSAHTFTLAVSQTGDLQIINFANQGGRWTPLNVVTGTTGGNPISTLATQTVNQNSTVSFFVKSNAAAKIAFQFAGATTQAGSPDTADIQLSQTSASTCGSVNPGTGQGYSISSPNTGGSGTIPLQIISDTLGQAFIAQATVVNPAANANIVHVNSNSSTRTIYVDKIYIECSAACTATVQTTGNLGTTCTAVANSRMNSGIIPSVSGTTANSNCATPPTLGAVMVSTDLIASTLVVIDMRGIVITSSSIGIEVILPVALTGTARASIEWYEK